MSRSTYEVPQGYVMVLAPEESRPSSLPLGRLMRNILLVIAVAAITLAGWVLINRPGATAFGVVTGRVENLSGEPVSRARVRLLDTELTALTDQEGAYRFDAVPQGEYWLEVSVEGGGGAKLPVQVLGGEVLRLPSVTVQGG